MCLAFNSEVVKVNLGYFWVRCWTLLVVACCSSWCIEFHWIGFEVFIEPVHPVFIRWYSILVELLRSSAWRILFQVLSGNANSEVGSIRVTALKRFINLGKIWKFDRARFGKYGAQFDVWISWIGIGLTQIPRFFCSTYFAAGICYTKCLIFQQEVLRKDNLSILQYWHQNTFFGM